MAACPGLLARWPRTWEYPLPASATALSRLASRGVLEQSSAGRASRYRITDGARKRLRGGLEQVSAFGEQSPALGRQLDRHRLFHPRDVAGRPGAVPVPAEVAGIRAALRCGLGFAEGPRGRTRNYLQGLRRGRLWSFFGQPIPPCAARDSLTPGHLRSSGSSTSPFIDKFGPWMERLDSGTVTPADALRVQDRAHGCLAGVPVERPPTFPPNCCPEAWPRTEAR